MKNPCFCIPEKIYKGEKTVVRSEQILDRIELSSSAAGVPSHTRISTHLMGQHAILNLIQQLSFVGDILVCPAQFGL